MIKGIIFDYNGTIVDDDKQNIVAWTQIINELSNNSIDFNALLEENRGLMDRFMVSSAYKKINVKESKKENDYWVQKKEALYRQLSKKDPNYVIPDSLSNLLYYIKERNIPINMCTASIIENIDFYFEFLGLGTWFDKNKVVYDNGIFENKTEMYKEAAKVMNLDIKDCLVFEDSSISIDLAIKAGCKNIISVKNHDVSNLPEVIQVIDDFSQVDKSLFE